MQHIITNNTLTVILDRVPKSLNRDTAGEETWNKAISFIKNDDVESLQNLLNTGDRLQVWAEGNIEVHGGVMFYKGNSLGDNYAARKAIEFMRDGLPYEPILAFIDRLMENPSYRAVEQLYQFLEANNMPLTEDGCFLAYKKITADYKDIYTQSIDNSIGQHVAIPRNQVDEDPDRTCSHGLHVCGYGYLSMFGRSHGDVVVAVKIDPADVVAVPHDYQNAKMRVCAYTVLEEVHDYRETDSLTKERIWGYTPPATFDPFADLSDIEIDDDWDEDDDNEIDWDEEDEVDPAHAGDLEGRPVGITENSGANRFLNLIGLGNKTTPR